MSTAAIFGRCCPLAIRWINASKEANLFPCSAWVRNTDLHELDPKTVRDNLPSKMTKALESAYRLASENHTLDHYKEILRKHVEEALLEEQARKEAEQAAMEAKEAKEAAKAQATPAKKSHKKKAKTDDEDDVEMADADEEEGSETAKKSKKRKADESAEVRDQLSDLQHCS